MRLRIQAQRILDLIRRFVVFAFLGQNAGLHGVGLGQIGIECQRPLGGSKPAVAFHPVHA